MLDVKNAILTNNSENISFLNYLPNSGGVKISPPLGDCLWEAVH